MNSLEIKNKLFPEVVYVSDDEYFGWYTWIRVYNHDVEEWYLYKVSSLQYIGNVKGVVKKWIRQGNRQDLLKTLIKNAFHFRMIGSPSENDMDSEGNPVFFVDECQESELERVKKLV